MGLPLELLPLHQNDRFSCSILKPVLSSCPLYADCRFACYSSSHQSLSQDYARSLVLTVSVLISTPHQGFTYVHLLNTYLTTRVAFSLIAHDNCSLQKPHREVWFQLLVVETERPTLIFNTAQKAHAFLHDARATRVFKLTTITRSAGYPKGQVARVSFSWFFFWTSKRRMPAASKQLPLSSGRRNIKLPNTKNVINNYMISSQF